MRKAFLFACVITIGTGIVYWLGASFVSFGWGTEVAAAAARPWPAGMGTLEDARERFPPLHANDASRKLMALATALPKNPAVDDFVRREIATGEVRIGEPPALPDLSAIRELLLHAPIVWERHAGLGTSETEARRVVHVTIARMLVASALTKARADDRAAWDDLHAVWMLARTLDGHPQMMAQTASLSMARIVNAVAWKMPLPAPAWFGELQERDYVRPLLEAFQYLAASYWNDDAPFLPRKWLAAPLDHDRVIAEEVFKETRCDVHPRANELGTDLTSV